MSTTPSALSAGLQVLSNAGLLPSSLNTQQLQNMSQADLTKIAVANIESTGLSTLFGGAASSGDTVSLSSDPTAVLLGENTSNSGGGISDPMLQALETAATTAGNAASGTSGTTTTAPTTTATAAATAAATAQAEVGSLFSYLG